MTVTIDDVPVNLMPVALALGYAFVAAFGRLAVHSLTSIKTPKPSKYGISGAVAFALYCLVMGRIEGAFQKASHAQFDPYAILELSQYNPQELNKTIVTSAYRSKVLYYHPSNKETGDTEQMQQVMFAFQALTDESAKRQWKLHGHPSGPLLTPIFRFAIPSWLWSGTTGMVAAHGMMLALIVAFVYQEYQTSRLPESAREVESMDDIDWNFESNTVHDKDFSYLAQNVKPDMSHYEILVLVLSAPSNLAWGRKDVEKIERIRQDRLSQNTSATSKKFTYDSLVNEGGWADEDEEESEEAKEAKRREEENAKSEKKVEGIDEGVLGQKWVEQTLEGNGEWPPKELGCLRNKTFDWKGSNLPPLEHPVIRRLLCMMTGRLNSQMLNSHPDLVQAGINKLIDQTYFQSSLTFRHRMGLLLEAVLKIATSFQSYRLVKTAIETVTIYKIGCKLGSEKWFTALMEKQYGVPPRLNLTTLEIATPEEAEIATGENTQVTFEIERLHAENFLRQKLAQLQQQGIPPQVGLQAYREGWWFLVYCERLDGEGKSSPLNRDDPVIKKMEISDEQFALFNNEDPKDRLLVTLPMILGNISQKQIKAQGLIKAPIVAGSYRFTLEIKSLDFLGADVSRVVNAQVVDASTVVRKEKEETGESKKEK